MSILKTLGPSEKKQLAVIAGALIGIAVFLFVSYRVVMGPDNLTIDEALKTAGDADKIDRMAIEISRMQPSATKFGQPISQYEIQNPSDGGIGDDGSYDSAVNVVSGSTEEAQRLSQSVDITNGISTQDYLNKTYNQQASTTGGAVIKSADEVKAELALGAESDSVSQ